MLSLGIPTRLVPKNIGLRKQVAALVREVADEFIVQHVDRAGIEFRETLR